jgi:hypothetical protein
MRISLCSLALLLAVPIVFLACHGNGADPGGMFGDDPLDDPGDGTGSTVQICIPASDGSGVPWTSSVDESEVADWLAGGATLGACPDDGVDGDPDPGSGDDDDDDDDATP